MDIAEFRELFNEQGALLLMVLGGLLFVFTLISGTSTLAGCIGNEFGNGFYGTVYRIFGIYLPEFTFNIYLTEFRVVWYDGCNSHSNTLVWPIGGALAIGSGVALHRRS